MAPVLQQIWLFHIHVIKETLRKLLMCVLLDKLTLVLGVYAQFCELGDDHYMESWVDEHTGLFVIVEVAV